MTVNDGSGGDSQRKTPWWVWLIVVVVVVLAIVIVEDLVYREAEAETVEKEVVVTEIVEAEAECPTVEYPKIVIEVECPACPESHVVVNVEAEVEEVGIAEVEDEVEKEVEEEEVDETVDEIVTESGARLIFEAEEINVGNGSCDLYSPTGKGNIGIFDVEIPENWILVVDAWIINDSGDGPWIDSWDGPAEIQVSVTDGAVCLSSTPEIALADRKSACSACQEVKN